MSKPQQLPPPSPTMLPRRLTPPPSPAMATLQANPTFTYEEESLKENLGLLRRAFSSIKKRRKKKEGSPSPSRLQEHESLRAVRSHPATSASACNIYFSSPASDLAARRGVFSRRHYGSVELLASCDCEGKQQNAGRFRVETGERADCDEVSILGLSSPLNSPIHLENPEFQTRWYFKYFMGKLHQNYMGVDVDKEPFLMSVVVTDANNHNVPQYRAILWRKTGAKKICLPYNPSKPQTVKGILGHFDLDKLERGPKEIFDPEIQKELLVLEEQEGSVNFKIGVLYAKEGQTTDDEFYSNEEGSEAFYQLVDLLGERIKLKGWDKFKAGLDIKSNTTGEESVYTVYEGHEMMFHVSTLLPFSHDNKQQVERKRHIGNDIVNLVFFEGGDPDKAPAFKPNMMKTRFTHIFLVVSYNPKNNSYRLTVFSEESVPLFGPPLPVPPVFYDMEEFRDFLLVKMINGEKAAVNNPLFAQKRERTLEMLLRNLYQEYMGDANKNNVLYRRAFSDVIQDAHGSHRKEEARRLEFVRVGQTLKLKTILKGDAPTSLVTTGLLKREPWEPQQCHSDFCHSILCGDSWGDKLIVSTESGVMVLEEGQSPRQIFDKSVAVKQLSVVEVHGLLIMRVDKGKEGKIYVFRLNDFEGEVAEAVTRSRADCKDHRLERTKGCHLYALSRPGVSHLRMVVALGKRLLLFSWKHSAAWSVWCPSVDVDIVDSFTFLRELQCGDIPQLITLIEGVRGDNQICVGYKNQFDLINEKNGDTLQLYSVEAAKVSLVSALDIYEDDEAELILCYNHVSHFQKLREETCHDFDFHWNSEPHSIVCAFPYVMAFTPDTIEIRLIINGNLVHTTTMPDLTLITSKCDIYFASSAAHSASPKDKKSGKDSFSPPSSPSGSGGGPCLNVYKIPLSCLAGQISGAAGVATTDPKAPPAPGVSAPGGATLLAPVVSNGAGDRSPGSLKRSPLLRSKRVGAGAGAGAGLGGGGGGSGAVGGGSSFPSSSSSSSSSAVLSGGGGLGVGGGVGGGGGATATLPVQTKDRHDSSSSDSGITILRTSDLSPPSSPFALGALPLDPSSPSPLLPLAPPPPASRPATCIV
ncbi:GTPase-activating Rap/Ran-GAP domain-like protein 3 [Babylonia areolata]|uniref:GTPase-activating Rap/Ran-GAP domain-like protein 3 n=1 Tax=Babylonia areolata TaxID=304850 RepID=UPI003FD48B9A